MLGIMDNFLIRKSLYYFQNNNHKVDQFNPLTFFFLFTRAILQGFVTQNLFGMMFESNNIINSDRFAMKVYSVIPNNWLLL